MQKLMGSCSRCIEDYHMIEAGDRIAVGVSGGKDSLTLLRLLAAIREYYPKPFTLEAFTINLGLPDMDYGPVADFCRSLEVPYTEIPTQIGRSSLTTEKKKSLFHVRKDAPRRAARGAGGAGHPQGGVGPPF